MQSLFWAYDKAYIDLAKNGTSGDYDSSRLDKIWSIKFILTLHYAKTSKGA